MQPSLFLLKLLDRIVGRLTTLLFPRPGAASLRRPAIILFIRPGGIGDAVLLAPTIVEIKTEFPETTITVLAEKRNAGAFTLIPGVDRLLRYDVPREFLAAFRLHPDLVIDTEQYHRLSAVAARLTSASTLIGFGTNERARLLHHAVPYSHDDYEVDSFLHLLTPLGISPSASLDTPFLAVPAAAKERAAQLLAPLAGQPFIAIFPGASIPERRWGGERFARVAAELRQHGYAIVAVGGKADLASGAAIAQAAGGFNFAGRTSLVDTAAILARSALLISGDSGILHLGVGLGIPTVSLFGPGIAAKWAPRGPKHTVINKNLPCSPCTRFGYTSRCSRKAKCLTMIGIEEVVAAAWSLLPKL